VLRRHQRQAAPPSIPAVMESAGPRSTDVRVSGATWSDDCWALVTVTPGCRLDSLAVRWKELADVGLAIDHTLEV
jgi:hypothetical protein